MPQKSRKGTEKVIKSKASLQVKTSMLQITPISILSSRMKQIFVLLEKNQKIG